MNTVMAIIFNCCGVLLFLMPYAFIRAVEAHVLGAAFWFFVSWVLSILVVYLESFKGR